MICRINLRYLSSMERFVSAGTADCGDSMLRLLEDRDIDLMLLDIYMPGMNGIEALREVRRRGNVVDVVLISAADECRYLKEAIGLGALDYLIKPFSFDRFRSTLNSYTIYRRTLDTLASGAPLSQEVVDGVFSFRTLRDTNESIGELPKGLQEGTLEKIIETLRSLGTAVTCEETAASAGIAPATVRRYLGHLVQKSRVSIDLEYHATGRPVNRYRLR